ncbi:uncharacterized protein [Typha latifolia]|uniref:uncharacterized protein n=1 Tax=Typha latifolia TaxID=4733 RepID=UPI003C2F6B56
MEMEIQIEEIERDRREEDEERWEGGGAASVLNLASGSSISVSYHPRFESHDDLLLIEVDDKVLLYVLGRRVEGSNLWSLDEKRVCLQFAKQILVGGKMKLENFKEIWMQSIPSGMCADLKMLEAEVLFKKLGVETWIRSFSVGVLPSNPTERFAALFKERPKWEWKDLEPYIRDLRVPDLSSEGLLIKCTRRTQSSADVEPVFSAR